LIISCNFLDVEKMILVYLLTQVTNIKELTNLMYFTFTVHINIKYNLHTRIHFVHTWVHHFIHCYCVYLFI